MVEFTRIRLLAILSLLAQGTTARHRHSDHLHRLIRERQAVDSQLESSSPSRLVPWGGGSGGGGGGGGALCAFPADDPDLVAVTPDMENAGWAMAPDRPCKPGMYCPYACSPGKVMAQWEPGSAYTYPQSVNGGLYCDEDGEVSKPFPDKPYCVEGSGTVVAVNEQGDPLSFCQTVLPGWEDMLIPTMIAGGSHAVLAVPDTSYWCETAAHYYINPPGVGPEGCVWGHKTKAIGNWTPYVAGTNMNADGETFCKVGWNPVWMEEKVLMAALPTFGVRVECDEEDGCNGLPCEIDPRKAGINGVDSKNSATGAGGGDFCVVTVPKGKTARIVVFDASGLGSGSEGDNDDNDDDDDDDEDTPPPNGIQISIGVELGPASIEASVATSVPVPSASNLPVPASTSISTSASALPIASTSTSTPKSSTALATSTASPAKMPAKIQLSLDVALPTVAPGIFHQDSINGTATNSTVVSSSQRPLGPTSSALEGASVPDAAPTESRPGPSEESQQSEGSGRQKGSAAVGLLVAFVAMAYLY